MKPCPSDPWLPLVLLLLAGWVSGCRTAAPSAVPEVTPSPAVEGDLAARVEAFVRQTHLHGVPYEAAREFGAGAIPILEAMLADETEMSTWPNVVVTLAIVGDSRVGRRLIEFVRQDAVRRLSPSHCMAKYSALMALGYLVNHTSDPASLEFLVQAARPAYWEELAPRWSSPFESTSVTRNLQLANMAMLGLALSGHPDAIRALESMREPELAPAGRQLQAARSGLLDEALEASRMIARDGLTEYYLQAGREHPTAPATPTP